jgi:hypothetical protein
MIQKFLFLLIVLCFSAYSADAQIDTTKIVKEKNKKIVIKTQKKRNPYQDSVYQWRVAQSHLDNFYIPTDINDCFKQLDKLMETSVKQRFMAFSDEEVDRKTHASLGRWIDHKWQISDGSRISYYFYRMGVPSPEYTIGIIITSYHRYLHKKDLKLKEQVAYFKALWEEKKKERVDDMLKN